MLGLIDIDWFANPGANTFSWLTPSDDKTDPPGCLVASPV